MTPLLHFSAGVIPRSTFKNTKKDIHLNKCNSKRRPLLLQPTFPLSWIPNRSSAKTRILTSAVEADVILEADQNINSETSEEAEPISEEAEEAASTLPDATVKGYRKDVKKEELVPGAKFTGIVRSMQPFGVFVDIGSFTDGLVHISKISSDYVKDVKELFTVGQEVEVRLLDYDIKTNRISLSMRDPEDENEGSFKPSSRGGTGKGGYTRRRPRYGEGDEFLGTVKEITEEGALVTLPGDGEGFLPVSEQVAVDGGEADATLEIDQDIMVRVLSVDEDEIILTMKEDEYVDNELLDILKKEEDDFAKKVGKGYEALEEEMEEDEEEEVQEGAVDMEEVSKQAPIEDSTVNVDTGTMFVNPFVFTFLRSRYAANAGKQLELIGAEKKTGSVVAANPAVISGVAHGEVADSNDGSEVGSASITEESLGASELGEGDVNAVAVEEVGATTVETVPEASESGSVSVSNVIEVSDSVVEEAAAIFETGGSEVAISEEPVAAAEDVSGVAESEVTAEVEKGGDAAALAVPEVADSEKASESTVTDPSSGSSDVEVAEINAVGAVSDSTVTKKSVGDSQEESDQKEEVSGAAPETREVQATISPALVKQLREETGAGMMDCKKALAETNGDLAKAQEYLRKKGLASADKKASRATAEGRIGSYVHDGRIGVLVEVNCETDFVSRGDIFKELVEDLAMQVAACPQVTYLTSDEIPEEKVKKEKEIEMQREDILSKPENIREKIVEGRIRKRLEEFALLEQPFIKNDKVVVKDYVKQTIATIGENIKVKRFVRFNLGEGLEKKSQDFAAEVAAQTAAKPAVTASDAAPPAEKAEVTETAEKSPSKTVSISPALVKQLREETGAGMMDCKKALAETGGDIEKAQEFLRKKGLSSADKKSSRLAAEGLISAYIHDSRIGCLIEVNSETDFVARNETFKELANDLAMQVVACPQVEYVSMDEVPASVIEKEKVIEMQREDLQSKPEQIRERIVEGRISKRLGELALLEQPFIKDDSITVKELVKRTIATLGENIKVRRFVRFTLGESTD